MTAKRQHYNPQFYLRYFLPAGEKTFWVYDKEGGEPRRQAPLNTGIIGNFYTAETPTGERVDLENESPSQSWTAGRNPELFPSHMRQRKLPIFLHFSIHVSPERLVRCKNTA